MSIKKTLKFEEKEIRDFFRKEKNVFLFLILFHVKKIKIVDLIKKIKEEKNKELIAKINNLDSLLQRQKIYNIIKEMSVLKIITVENKFSKGKNSERQLRYILLEKEFIKWLCFRAEVDLEDFLKFHRIILKNTSQNNCISSILYFLSKHNKKIDFILICNYINSIFMGALNSHSPKEWGVGEISNDQLQQILNLKETNQDLDKIDFCAEDVAIPFQLLANSIEKEEFSRLPHRKRIEKDINTSSDYKNNN